MPFEAFSTFLADAVGSRHGLAEQDGRNARLRIVGDRNIGAAVVIEIGDLRTPGLRSRRNVGPLRNVASARAARHVTPNAAPIRATMILVMLGYPCYG